MRTTTRLAIVVGLLLSASGLLLQAGMPPRDRQAGTAAARAGGSETSAASLRQRMPELMEQAGVQGVQIAVISGGTAAWHASFGLANAETKAPVTDASVFEAASLSKPVFAYAVLTLVDAGLNRPGHAHLEVPAGPVRRGRRRPARRRSRRGTSSATSRDFPTGERAATP